MVYGKESNMFLFLIINGIKIWKIFKTIALSGYAGKCLGMHSPTDYAKLLHPNGDARWGSADWGTFGRALKGRPARGDVVMHRVKPYAPNCSTVSYDRSLQLLTHSENEQKGFRKSLY